MKISKFICLVSMAFILYPQLALAQFINDNIRDVLAVQQQIYSICDTNDATLLDPELIAVINNTKTSKSIKQINIAFRTWVIKYSGRINSERDYLTQKDMRNLIVALHSWTYCYEALLHSLSTLKYGEQYIQVSIANNIFLSEGSYFKNYLAWLQVWDDLSKRSFDILDAEGKSWTNRTKDYVRWTTGLNLVSKDYWAEGILPRDAVAAIKPYKETVNLRYLSDEWYFMIRQYKDMQESFYEMKNIRDKIIKYYAERDSARVTKNDEYSSTLNFLHKYDHIADLYFKKVDTVVRYYLFDVPIQQLSWYSYLRCKAAQHWIDDKEELRQALVQFTMIKQFPYTVDPNTNNYMLKVASAFKRNYDDKEYEQMTGEVKLSKEWYDLLPKVEDPKPDTKFNKN